MSMNGWYLEQLTLTELIHEELEYRTLALNPCYDQQRCDTWIASIQAEITRRIQKG